jgi:hypothetical protein
LYNNAAIGLCYFPVSWHQWLAGVAGAVAGTGGPSVGSLLALLATLLAGVVAIWRFGWLN